MDITVTKIGGLAITVTPQVGGVKLQVYTGLGRGGVEQYADVSSFPATGLINILYIAKDTNKPYYWDGTTEDYVEITAQASGVTKEDVTGIKIADSPEFANTQITRLTTDTGEAGDIPAAQWTWLGATAKSVLSVLTKIIDKLYNKLDATVTFNDQVDDYALLATDKNKHIRMQKATATNLTINDVFASGESCTVEQNGAGQVTFVAGSGVTLRSAESYVKTRVRYSGVSIVRTSVVGEYEIFGDLTS